MPRLPEILDFDLNLPRPPFWLVAVVMLVVVASWLPLVMISRSRVSLSENRRIHIFQDMDNQPHLKAQEPSPVFADGRAMRPAIEGTVARGDIIASDHFVRGYELVAGDDGRQAPQFFQGMPEEIQVNPRLLDRGRLQFNIYCYPCHGLDGGGNGPINQRAQALARGGAGAGTVWIPPSDLHAPGSQPGTLQFGAENYPDGQLFHVITNGVRNMPSYRSQIDVADRWAIVAYVRALQLSQNAPREMLSPQEQETLR